MKFRFLVVAQAIVFSCISDAGKATVTDLKIQNDKAPLAIEDRHPVFSWKMESSDRGACQKAYQITVTREAQPLSTPVPGRGRSAGQFGSAGPSGITDQVMWDSGKVESGESTGIKYIGVALQRETGYKVHLTVWDNEGGSSETESRFETVIMKPSQAAWNGAEFIGTHENTLDAASQAIFDIETNFRIVKGQNASLVLGANDFRLRSSFLNGYGMESVRSYIKVTLDVGDGEPELRIYRVGYFPGDSEDTPILTVNKASCPDNNLGSILLAGVKHSLRIHVEAGAVSFNIDGQDLIGEPRTKDGDSGRRMPALGFSGPRATSYTLNRLGSGGNYPTFPNLAEVGFAAEAGSEVEYTDYKIMNGGASIDNIVFGADRYSIFSGGAGVTVSGNSITIRGTEKAVMVTADPSHGAETMMRTEFTTADRKTVKSARLYATAMGIYSLYLNGQKVGKDWFAPGDSQYRETLGYFKYDVTDMIKAGRNALGAELSGGWYVGYLTFTVSNFNFFGDHTALMARLVIQYEDGSKEEILTRPESWKVYNDGPIRLGSFFMGERYDARKIVRGWSEPGFDDSAWSEAEKIDRRDWVHFDIVARYDQCAQLRQTLTAQSMAPVSDAHTHIYNMGVNMVGVPSVTIPAGWLKKGDTVILTYGEQLYPGLRGDKKEYIDRFGKKGRNVAGHILYETNRAAMDADFYTASDSEQVTIQPSKTFRGYQYIQIYIPGHEGALPLGNVKGLVISSSEIPTGTYNARTPDGNTAALVNQLFKNIQRSQLGNYMTIPTDCPQRNERMGWTGDAQAYTRTGIYNADVQNFNRQWMVALRADQGIGGQSDVPGGIGSTVPTYNQYDDESFANGTTWSAAVCMVPWQIFNQYGDTQIIEENLESMMNWLNGMAYYKSSKEHPYLSAKASGLADWLALDGRTPSDLVNNAIYIYMMEVTAKMAEAVGRIDYAQMLRIRHDLAKADWNSVYVNPANGKTRDVSGKVVNTQTSYATPLNFNTFSDENRSKAEEHLAELAANPSASGPTPEEKAEEEKNAPAQEQGDPMMSFGGPTSKDYSFKPFTITTGFSGTPNILPALSRAGRSEEAYKMFSCTDFASWLYPVTKGATSIWERWNSLETAFSEPNQNSMNSFNHFALGAVGQWMYEYQLGITANYEGGEYGYRHFILQPTCGGTFTSLEGSYESNYGTIRSFWTASRGVMTSYSATIPANTSATIYLPIEKEAKSFGECPGCRFTGRVIHLGHETARYEVVCGTYAFSAEAGIVTVK